MTKWRAASLIAVHLAAAAHFLHWRLCGQTLAPVEPSEMFDTLHRGVLTVGFIFTAGAVLATVVFGRFFCGWGCHILALQDLSAWALSKVGVKAAPIRSRALAWVPAGVAVYLFVLPQALRLVRGEPLPRLTVVTDRDEWTSLVTDDLLRSFPGLAMTLVTFLVCGFAVVYFLGSRGFCAYACPYGALFGIADRVSPRRVVAGPGACSDCGLCVKGCKSNVQVIHEVRQYGAVVDPSCFKDLDCVTACPTGAIQIGWALPSLALQNLTKQDPLKRTKVPYDFGLGEEVLLAATFLGSLAVTRGLYDSVSLLLALTLSALVAFAAVVGVRLLRRDNAEFRGVPLKKDAAFTPYGSVAAAALVSLGLLVGHSAVVRYHEHASELALMQLAHLENSGAKDEATQAAAQALASLEAAESWGLVTPAGWRRQLATLYLRQKSPADARRHATALLAGNPNDYASRLTLASCWFGEGRPALARSNAEQLVEVLTTKHSSGPATLPQRRVLAGAQFLLAELARREGDQAEAVRQLEASVAAFAKDADAQFTLATLHLAAGRRQAAESALMAALAARPGHAAARQALEDLPSE